MLLVYVFLRNYEIYRMITVDMICSISSMQRSQIVLATFIQIGASLPKLFFCQLHCIRFTYQVNLSASLCGT